MKDNSILPSFANVIKTLFQYKRLLYSTTRYELQKRYAGYMLGYAWIVLYPLLFLCVYLFLWLVVFNVRFPGLSELDYVVFVFSGLVPFLFFSESVTSSVFAIKQNIHLLKNVIMPVDLIPARVVGMALPGYLVGLFLLCLLSIFNHTFSWNLIGLISAAFLQIMFIMGLCFFLTPLGLLLPDLGNIINLIVALLMFVSPIAFKPDMVPSKLKFIVLINPITYMSDIMRNIMTAEKIRTENLIIFALISFLSFWMGTLFFQRFKAYIVEYE